MMAYRNILDHPKAVDYLQVLHYPKMVEHPRMMDYLGEGLEVHQACPKGAEGWLVNDQQWTQHFE